MATNGNVNHHSQYAGQAQTLESAPSSEQQTTAQPQLKISEISWFFVEQYYTTLSKTPERIHLFYGKGSQFVIGAEGGVNKVSLGRQQIQARIKEQDFVDTKVRITNVDCQSSLLGGNQNIVIQVIGEISVKNQDSDKFVQTFVLAEQPSGYFILNDMFRYIKEEPLDGTEASAEAETAAPTEVAATEVEAKAETAPAVEEAVEEKEPAELETNAAAPKVEETSVPAEPESIETPAAEPVPEVSEAPVAEDKTEAGVPDADKVVKEIAEEEVKKPEEPKDPAPTPATVPVPARAAAPAPVATPAAEPEKPKEPPKPMTWASRVGANAAPARPVVPIPKPATPAAAVPRAPAPAATPQQAAVVPPQPAEATPASAAAKNQSEWQTAETKRQSRSQPAAAAVPDKEGAMAYIKYVTDKVKEEDLRAHLNTFGELEYFDINRTKNCAFVEFKTVAAYNAAIAANPHTVNGETIQVEQRRPKANAYGGSNYNASRGGAAGRGNRGGYESTRTGSQGGRGGFTGQSRGGRGGGAPRGRGGAQAGTTA